MRLYIGKNHDEKGASVPIQSVFRLVGKDEDALTYALGFLLARYSDLCAEFAREFCGVEPNRSFKDSYAVHLQEVTDRGFGRRDIVIEAGKVRIVIEAKIGNAQPTSEQILKYSSESAKWKNFTTRVVVSLTQGKLPPTTEDEVVSKLLRRPKIRFAAIQWHEVIDLVLQHEPSDGSEVSQYLFDEFITYVRKDYNMGYYDAEILIPDTDPYNARIFEEGWIRLSSLQKSAPLYVAPYFTKRSGDSGISMISRVIDDRRTFNLNDDVQDVLAMATDEQRDRWRNGLSLSLKRVDEERLAYPLRVLFLDKPIRFRSVPLTKKAFNATGPSKKIPNQIPGGFHLRFDELLAVN